MKNINIWKNLNKQKFYKINIVNINILIIKMNQNKFIQKLIYNSKYQNKNF